MGSLKSHSNEGGEGEEGDVDHDSDDDNIISSHSIHMTGKPKLFRSFTENSAERLPVFGFHFFQESTSQIFGNENNQF